jgi:signal transduction histidine kinase
MKSLRHPTAKRCCDFEGAVIDLVLADIALPDITALQRDHPERTPQHMNTPQIEPAQQLRDKTDQSLDEERDKTDEYLNRKSQGVEEETSESIRLNRLAADEDRESHRAELDLDKAEHRHDATRVEALQFDDESLIQERERSDKAQQIEREKEDRDRSKERFQQRLIAEALLAYERKETDSNLQGERVCMDLASEQHSALLAVEQFTHNLTKAALVTRDQFLAIVSHDLKNPLAAISIGARLLRKAISREALDTVSLLKDLGLIERSAAHMDRMISDLLDVERMAHDKLTLKPERMDLRHLLQECRDLFAPVVVSKSFTMTIHAGPEPLVANIDHDRLFQVFSNLIGNALKFTPNGGTIKLSARKQATEVELSVTDNGPGIPDTKQATVFERFSQLNTTDRHGLGLGLFIAKSIVEAHKGRIWVTSAVGKGTTLTFTIPLAVSQ